MSEHNVCPPLAVRPPYVLVYLPARPAAPVTYVAQSDAPSPVDRDAENRTWAREAVERTFAWLLALQPEEGDERLTALSGWAPQAKLIYALHSVVTAQEGDGQRHEERENEIMQRLIRHYGLPIVRGDGLPPSARLSLLPLCPHAVIDFVPWVRGGGMVDASQDYATLADPQFCHRRRCQLCRTWFDPEDC